MNKEPSITINGHHLFEGQAVAVRVAVSNFLMELDDEQYRHELGPIGDAYRDRLNEVLKFYMNTKP